MNGLKIQWVNQSIDSGSSTGNKITFPIDFTNNNTYVTNIDYFFISTIAAVGTVTKTKNSITWQWDTRTIKYGGIIAIGY